MSTVSAGRVMPLPKGAYDATTTYHVLDIVSYNDASYICKATTTGNLPTNSNYWQLLAAGGSGSGGTLFVTLTQSGSTYTADKTPNDIDTALAADMSVIAVANDNNNYTLYWPLISYKSSTGRYNFGVTAVSSEEDAVQSISLTMTKASSSSWQSINVGEYTMTGGGLLPHIIIISETGSTVTLTKGQTVISATETSTGHFEADVTDYGTWTIDSILSGDDAQVTLNVDDVKIYTITDEHFSASITVSYPSGGMCTLSATGQNPQVATSSPYTFTVHAATTYTLTATNRGATRTGTVVITTNGQSETYTFLVDGATVFTTDYPEIWLDCICYWDKNYTTEAEIIADSETLLALIADHNAVDYMARSGSFRTQICADPLAMLYIGQYNYCADALLNDSSWCTSIRNSEYFELVLNTKVPVMTGNTTPSGEVTSSGYDSSNYPYLAFDGNDLTTWQNTNTSTDVSSYLDYEFLSNARFYYFSALFQSAGSTRNKNFNFKIQGSVDGTAYDDLYSITGANLNDYQLYEGLLLDSNSYKHCRMYLENNAAYSGSVYYTIVKTLQFYGRTDVTPPSSRTLKTFATATDAEILEMVCKADRGEIDLYEDAGWVVGQEHSTSISAIPASGTGYTVGEDQPAQTVTFVLMHKGLYELVNPVLDTDKQTRNTCSFIAGMKGLLSTTGYMNSTNTNSGSWNGSARRAWCNYGFRNALPPALRAAFKQFKTITAQTYNGSTNQTSNDYFALVAEKEIFGSATYSNTTEANALTQFVYYETPANRIKKHGESGNTNGWWSRSPRNSSNAQFCETSRTGGVGADNASITTESVSPFGCF